MQCVNTAPVLLLMTVGLSLLGQWSCNARAVGPSLQKINYTILIDGGSTGSKMYVYKILLNKKGKVDAVSDLEEIRNSLGKVRPGLSSFLDKTEGISSYMKKFICEAKKIIPEDNWPSTKILVLATAGMRILPEADQDVIMKKVREVLGSKDISPFLYKKDNVKVISGKDEAIFGWLTVNFLKDVLTSNSSMRKPSWGTLDLGGASTQNAMSYKNKSVSTKLIIGEKVYRLFARSYLNAGLASIHKRFLEFLVSWDGKTEDAHGNLKSPCHHNGFKETFDIVNQKVGIVGAPNSEVCRELVDDMLFCTKNKLHQECPFEDQPKLTGNLVAFSAFHTVIDRIGAIICDNKPISVEQIGCAAKRFCSKPYGAVKGLDEKYTKFSCLWGNYIHQLFTKGYKINSKKKIFVLKELKGFSLSWIVGAVLYQSDLL